MSMIFGARCDDGPDPQSTRAKGVRRRRSETLKNPFDRIVELCAVRDRSEHELLVRLASDGYDDAAARQALKRAIDCGLVDNKRFADAYIRGRVRAGRGAEGVIRELAAKHAIECHDLSQLCADLCFDDDAETLRALEVLAASPPRAKDVWGAAYRKLASKGFSASVASRAARQYCEQALSPSFKTP